MSAIKLPDLEPAWSASSLPSSPHRRPCHPARQSRTPSLWALPPGAPPLLHPSSPRRLKAGGGQNHPTFSQPALVQLPAKSQGGLSAWLGSAPTYAGRMCPRAAATSRELILSHHQTPQLGWGDPSQTDRPCAHPGQLG